MTTLIICSHPDDETLGCGGTIARLTAEGHEVAVAVFADGVGSRFTMDEQRTPAPSPYHAAVAQRRAQFVQAMRVLGVAGFREFALPDNQFDAVPLLHIAGLVEQCLREIQPDVVYTHWGGDLNQDHALLHRATLIATRPQPGCTVRELLAYEVPSSTEWAFGVMPFQPNVFVDISGDLLARKIAAMACYAQEMRPYPHPRSPEALRARAQYWGSVAGTEAAEAFVLMRGVR